MAALLCDPRADDARASSSAMNGLVAFAGAATLPVGGAVLALAVIPELRRPAAVRPVLVLQAVLLALIVALGVGWRGRPVARARSARARQHRPPRSPWSVGLRALRRPGRACGTHLPAHPPLRRPHRRVRAGAAGGVAVPRRCSWSTTSSAGGSATRFELIGIGAGRRCRSRSTCAAAPSRARSRRPARQRAGERGRGLHGPDRARAAGAPRREGRLHGRAHARRRAAGGPGGRGARPAPRSRLRELAIGGLRARRRASCRCRTRSSRSRARSRTTSTTRSSGIPSIGAELVRRARLLSTGRRAWCSTTTSGSTAAATRAASARRTSTSRRASSRSATSSTP